MIDFERLCDREIYLSKIEPTDCAKLIKLFRDNCLQFSIQQNDIPMSDLGVTFSGTDGLSLLEGKHVADAMASLLNRPRLLKKTLRDVLAPWRSSLHGEVDFDDLFILRTIRAVCPKAFAAIKANYDDLVSSGRHWIYPTAPVGREDGDLKKFKSAWTSAIDVLDAESQENIRRLLKYLFPFMEPDIAGLVTRDRIWPQSAIDKKYWIRISEEIVDSAQSDQAIAKLTLEWISESSPNLVEKLAINDDASEVFERLQSSQNLLPQLRLDAENVRKLSSELFAKLRSVYGAKLTRDSSSSILAMWRLANDRGAFQLHYDWLLKEIEKALSTSLCFANDLDYFWGQDSRSVFRVYTDSKQSNELRVEFIDLWEHKLTSGFLVKFLGDSGRLLAKTIGVSDRACYSLHHAVRHFTGVESGRPEFDRSLWRWLPRVLVDAIKIDQSVLVHIAYLLSMDITTVEKSEEGFRTRKSRFDVNFFDDLFYELPAEGGEVLDALRQTVISTAMGFHDQTISRYLEIVDTIPAENW